MLGPLADWLPVPPTELPEIPASESSVANQRRKHRPGHHRRSRTGLDWALQCNYLHHPAPHHHQSLLGEEEQPALGLGSVAAALVDPRGKNLSINAEGRPDVPLARAGLYGVFDHGNQRIGSVAVNVDPVAGRTDPQDQAVVSEWLGSSGDWEVFTADDPGAALRTADSGAPLAGILLAAVLGLIVLETALARWFSHALPPAQMQPTARADLMAEAAPIAPHT